MRTFDGELYYSIGEFAKIIGKTVQTLRNWDNSCERCADLVTASGSRYYKESTVRRYCKAYNVPFDSADPANIVDAIDEAAMNVELLLKRAVELNTANEPDAVDETGKGEVSEEKSDEEPKYIGGIEVINADEYDNLETVLEHISGYVTDLRKNVCRLREVL